MFVNHNNHRVMKRGCWTLTPSLRLSSTPPSHSRGLPLTVERLLVSFVALVVMDSVLAMSPSLPYTRLGKAVVHFVCLQSLMSNSSHMVPYDQPERAFVSFLFYF